MVGCCVPGCGRNSSKPTIDERYKSQERNVTYHQFPADPTLRALWVAAVHIGGRVEEWQPSTNTKICSMHFDLKNIRIAEKGTQILKGAIPAIPLAAKKKPPRRSKAATREAVDSIVQEVISDENIIEEIVDLEVSAEILEFDLVNGTLFNPEVAGTSSEFSFSSALEAEEPTASMDVDKVAQEPQQSAKTKKVVKLADEHTFEAQAAANDPCLSLFTEVLQKMKELNVAVAKNHPSKALNMQKFFNDFTRLFDDKEAGEKSPNMLHANDPYMSNEGAAGLENLMFSLDENDPEVLKLLNNPEDYIFTTD